MLDRAKLMLALQDVSSLIFFDTSSEVALARRAFDYVASNSNFSEMLEPMRKKLQLPSWQGGLSEIAEVRPITPPYNLISVDGSQIYPDRHQGVSCFLINVGTVTLCYGLENSCVKMESSPYVFMSDSCDGEHACSTEWVNAKRELMELEGGVAGIESLGGDEDFSLLLFDGSLIFWYLDASDPKSHNKFLKKCVFELCKMREQNMVVASYVSAPRSRDLIKVLRLVLAGLNEEVYNREDRLKHLTDSCVANFFLKPGQRSTVFEAGSTVVGAYPDDVKPYFFYINVGYEMGRVEVPAWIAKNKELTDKVAGGIMDQVEKGSGYPVGLAEAHEQAVVKGVDREFFYHVLGKLGMNYSKGGSMSRKSLRKRVGLV